MKKIIFTFLMSVLMHSSLYAISPGKYSCHFPVYNPNHYLVFTLKPNGYAKIALENTKTKSKQVLERGYWNNNGDEAFVVKRNYVLVYENKKYYLEEESFMELGALSGISGRIECKKTK